MAKKKASKKKGRVVASAANMSGAAAIGGHSSLGKAIEEAMTAATYECLERGITDPDKIREAKLAARQRVKDEIARTAAKAAKNK